MRSGDGKLEDENLEDAQLQDREIEDRGFEAGELEHRKLEIGQLLWVWNSRVRILRMGRMRKGNLRRRT